MKDQWTFYSGSYCWSNNEYDIWPKDKKGKFFRGICRKFENRKKEAWFDIGFRLCKNETK